MPKNFLKMSKKQQPIQQVQTPVAPSVPKIWESKPFLLALLSNFVLFGLIYTFFTSHFQENDDVGMLLEAAGELIASEPTAYLLFTNILIGGILKSLYSIFPQTAWYGLYLVFVLFVTHIGIFYVLLKRLASVWAIILYLLYFFVAATHPLTSMQFTTVAALASTAGLAVLIFIDEKNWKIWIGGIFLVFLGSLVRFQSFILSFAMFAPVFLYFLIVDFKQLFQKILPLGLSLALVILGFFIQKTAYQQADWAMFEKTSPLIGEFVDNQALSKGTPEAQQKALAKANWTMVDYAMMGNWFFVDKDLYSFERASAALSELGIENRELKTDQIWEYQQKEIFARPAVTRTLILTLFFSLFFAFAKFEWISIGVSVLMMPFVLGIIHFILKQPPMHVYHPMFMHLALLPLFFLDKQKLLSFKENGAWIQKISIGILGLVLMTVFFEVIGELNTFSKQSKENRRNLRALVASMNPDANNLYVVWANSFPYELITPFENIDFVKNLNVFTLGSIQRTPIADKVLEKNQIQNIYTAIAEKPNVYLVVRADYLQRWVGLYAEFMKQHYQKQITARQVSQNGNMVVLDIGVQ